MLTGRESMEQRLSADLVPERFMRSTDTRPAEGLILGTVISLIFWQAVFLAIF